MRRAPRYRCRVAARRERRLSHTDEAPPDPGLPERIGSYRVLRVLGRGGMGIVFEAEQESPRRRVALKVVTSALPSEEQRRRFEREALVLGHLQHPGIAQVYEAGVHASAGALQPWFAMELVRGVPLDRFARERGLDTRARLELLARVCDAVQHAHQRGVIHRDLKPGNVLVDEAGAPRVLDFGLARATDADLQAATLHTDVGQIMGTIPYMSPEQAAGDPAALDARTDVYSLGVVGYELVSGSMPYDASDPMVLEALRVVREEEARPLSSIDRSLRGDVETILGKALAKEPARRYPSPAALAADIRRWLAHQPIEARRPSALYQLRKFARRNKALVGGVAAVFAALAIGLVGTARGYFAARAEAERAQRTSRFFERVLSGVDPAVAQGSDTTLLRAILDDTAERIDTEFAGRPDVEASIRGVMVTAYHAIGEFEAALRQAQAAQALFERTSGPESAEAIDAERWRGNMLGKLQRTTEAEEVLKRVVARATAALGADGDVTLVARAELGILYLDTRREDEAAALLEPVLARRRATLPPDDARVLVPMNALGLTRLEQSRFDEAEALLSEVLERRRATFGETHPETVKAVHNMGGLYSTTGRLAEAEALYREALARDVTLLGPEHDVTLGAKENLAGLLRTWRRFDEALALRRELYELLRAKFGAEDPRTLRSESRLATVERDTGRIDAALEHAHHAWEGLRAARGEDDGDVSSAAAIVAKLLKTAGRDEEALAIQRRLLDTSRRLDGEEDTDTLVIMNDLGIQCMDLGRLEEAEALVPRALAISRRVLGDGAIETLKRVLTLARLRQLQGRRDESVPLLVEFLAAWSGIYGDADEHSVRAANDLAGDLASVEALGPHEGAVRALLAYDERVRPDPSTDVAQDLSLLAEALTELGRAQEALEPLERALELWSRAGAAPPPRALAAYGAALAALGRPDEGLELLRAAWEDARALAAPERRRIARRLAEACASAGDAAEAARWRATLASIE